MSPTAENLERFVKANSLTLSAGNREIMTLQDIARKGYAHLYMDGPFRYGKEFAGIEKELRTLAGKRDLYRDFPYEERIHDLREKSRTIAEFLLKREGIRREMPSGSRKRTSMRKGYAAWRKARKRRRSPRLPARRKRGRPANKRVRPPKK